MGQQSTFEERCELKQRLWREQSHWHRARCCWCPKRLRYKEATIDHEPPLAEGGCWDNAVLACYECNQRRGEATSRRLQNIRQRRIWKFWRKQRHRQRHRQQHRQQAAIKEPYSVKRQRK